MTSLAEINSIADQIKSVLPPPGPAFETSESIEKLAEALAAAQGEITTAALDAEGQSGNRKYPYSTLASVWAACREPLSKNGLSVVQPLACGEMVTMLMHTSGQWIRSREKLTPTDPSDHHAVGSAHTYMQRYMLRALIGIPSYDDDAAAARDARKPAGTSPTRTAPKDGQLAQSESRMSAVAAINGWLPEGILPEEARDGLRRIVEKVIGHPPTEPLTDKQWDGVEEWVDGAVANDATFHDQFPVPVEVK